MQGTQGGIWVGTRGGRDLCVSSLQTPWNLYKSKSTSKLKYFPVLSSSYRVGGTKCSMTSHQMTDPELVLGLGSGSAWLPRHCTTHPRALGANRFAKSEWIGAAWWGIAGGPITQPADVSSGNSLLQVATFLLHISLQPAIRGIAKLLARRLGEVTDWRRARPSTFHSLFMGPINTGCLPSPLPQTNFIPCRSLRSFAQARNPQPSHEDPLPALCCSLPPLPGCSRWDAS